ncbi:hypothetical protein ACIPVK_17985 [Paeniglutamicibacter sp. MACA_103]|uniref:hypothetical protein n=1 Tax=Paeniglutamicibacter sp. MACA_103 TaxID=3377337 RepID=UPI0038960C50
MQATGLVTVADLNYNTANRDRIAVSVRLAVVLDTGRSVLLLDDRGWSSSQKWSQASVVDIRETALVVVGPDEPSEDQDEDDMAAEYWEHLSDLLEQQDLAIDPAELRELPHDVRLSQRLLKRIGTAVPGS